MKGHILTGKGLVQWINGKRVMRGMTLIDSCDNALLLVQPVGMLITKTHAVVSRRRKTARPMQRLRSKRHVKGRDAQKAWRLYEWGFRCLKDCTLKLINIELQLNNNTIVFEELLYSRI